MQYNKNFTETYEIGQFQFKIDGYKYYEACSKQNQLRFSIKIISKQMCIRAKIRLQQEIEISKQLNHQNFLKLHDVCEDDLNFYLIYEHISNQYVNLEQIIQQQGRLNEQQVIPIVSQLIEALRYLNSKNIIHRDLKLNKILLGDSVKLVEFTQAAQLEFDGQRRKSICGTPSYIAPEIIHQKEGYSFEIDIWSLGVIIYTLLIGKKPFEYIQKTPHSGYYSSAYTIPEDVDISIEAKDFIVSILQEKPEERSSLDDLINHSFMKNRQLKN